MRTWGYIHSFCSECVRCQLGSNGGSGGDDDDHQFKCDVASHPPGNTAMAAANWSATAMCPLPMLPLERTFAHMLHMYLHTALLR